MRRIHAIHAIHASNFRRLTAGAVVVAMSVAMAVLAGGPAHAQLQNSLTVKQASAATSENRTTMNADVGFHPPGYYPIETSQSITAAAATMTMTGLPAFGQEGLVEAPISVTMTTTPPQDGYTYTQFYAASYCRDAQGNVGLGALLGNGFHQSGSGYPPFPPSPTSMLVGCDPASPQSWYPGGFDHLIICAQLNGVWDCPTVWPAPPPSFAAINAVGMGDSYSSGEGVDPYDSGTDTDWGDNRNQCHRSAYAYSRLMTPIGYDTPVAEVAKAGPPTTFDFIACAGARTYNVKTTANGGSAQYTEGAPQVGQGKADANTDLVVLSIGGNDIGFSDLVKLCAYKACNDPNTKKDGKQVKEWGRAQLDALPAKLARALGDIKAAAPNATVVLMGYPHLFPASAQEQGCAKLTPWAEEMDWFNQSADQLDNTMRNAAASAGVRYVSQLAVWAGHEICGNGGEWLNGITASNPADKFHNTWVGTGSFHPNRTGQALGYAATLNAQLKPTSGSMPTTPAGLARNPAPVAARLAAAASPPPAGGDLGTLYVGSSEGDPRSACLSDNLVRAGATVRVGGEGFAPGAVVSVAFDTAVTDATAPPILGALTADASGRVQGSVIIPAAGEVDTSALLRATGAGGPGGGQNELIALVGIAAPCAVAPPTVDAGPPVSGTEGSPTALHGTVSDPHDPNPTSIWSVTPGPGVDPGASCTFIDPKAVDTTITCTDDGTFTATLTAHDGFGGVASDTTMVTVANAPPAVSITKPTPGQLAKARDPVTVTAPFTDPGRNDTHTCSVTFGDGSAPVAGTVTEASGAGSCTATHAYPVTTLGPRTIVVTITDDDRASATAQVRMVIFLPGSAFAIEATGLITVPRTPNVICPPNNSQSQPQLNVGVGTINGLNASCTLDPTVGHTTATSSITDAKLLGGVITISTSESRCEASAAGIVRSSRVGTINGIPIGTGSGSIAIPGVAQVFFNETTTNASGQSVQNAIRVVKPPVIILGIVLVPGQEITLAGCRLG
jgi:hypothetical protein